MLWSHLLVIKAHFMRIVSSLSVTLTKCLHITSTNRTAGNLCKYRLMVHTPSLLNQIPQGWHLFFCLYKKLPGGFLCLTCFSSTLWHINPFLKKKVRISMLCISLSDQRKIFQFNWRENHPLSLLTPPQGSWNYASDISCQHVCVCWQASSSSLDLPSQLV